MPPKQKREGPVLAWSAGGDSESLAMALSVLGLRVRAFDRDEAVLPVDEFDELLETFDALVDPLLMPATLAAAIEGSDARFVLETGSPGPRGLDQARLPAARMTIVAQEWDPLCTLLSLSRPPEPFPVGVPRQLRMFRDDRPRGGRAASAAGRRAAPHDDSPWVLPARTGWRPRLPTDRTAATRGDLLVHATMKTPVACFLELVETFPGNLAAFTMDGLARDENVTHLLLDRGSHRRRPYRSGAFASRRSFAHGRFEAEIRAARGSGLVTGFFLHRDAPRQEIDVELAGSDPRTMLANVYFNPATMGQQLHLGIEVPPWQIDLGFDATEDFHLYAIDWRPGLIAWSVDGRIVHERVGWDPTPLPHLPMRLYANLWAPRSAELAGRVNEEALPARATFRNVSIWA